MTLWLIAGAIAAFAVLWDTGSVSFEGGIHLNSDHMASTLGVAFLITLCGGISFICIAGNYGFEIYDKIRNRWYGS